jgi:hypothetical protein
VNDDRIEVTPIIEVQSIVDSSRLAAVFNVNVNLKTIGIGESGVLVLRDVHGALRAFVRVRPERVALAALFGLKMKIGRIAGEKLEFEGIGFAPGEPDVSALVMRGGRVDIANDTIAVDELRRNVDLDPFPAHFNSPLRYCAEPRFYS